MNWKNNDHVIFWLISIFQNLREIAPQTKRVPLEGRLLRSSRRPLAWSPEWSEREGGYDAPADADYDNRRIAPEGLSAAG